MKKTLAVHLHLYYDDQIADVLNKLSCLQDIDYDLYITVAHKNSKIVNQIKTFNPETKIIEVENRGYDMGPFVEFLHNIDLKDYKYILKLHTKGKYSRNYTRLNNRRFDNALWGKVLWNSLLASKKRVQKDLMLLQNPHIGLVSSKYCINHEECHYQKLLPQINQQLEFLGFNKTEKLEFVAGSMFYVKSDLLRPLLKFKLNDFSLTDGRIKEGTLAHVIERVIGVIVKDQGYDICGVRDWTSYFMCLFVSLKRFIYQRKVTNKNKLLIKIFKLPIYSRRLNTAFETSNNVKDKSNSYFE